MTFSGKNLEGKNNCIVDLGYYSSQAKLNESISHIKLFKQQIFNVPRSTINEKNVSQAKNLTLELHLSWCMYMFDKSIN